MKRTSSRLLIAALIAVAGTLAQAQPMQGPQGRGGMGAGMDRETAYKYRMEFYELRMAEFKALLKLTPEQEAAWKSFTAVMQPLPQPFRITPAEFNQLTPEQRAERRQQRDTFQQARTEQRGQAIATFRAQLTPEQQQVFDQHVAQYRIQSATQGGMRGGMQGGKGMGRGMGGGMRGGGMGGGGCGGAPGSCAQ